MAVKSGSVGLCSVALSFVLLCRFSYVGVGFVGFRYGMSVSLISVPFCLVRLSSVKAVKSGFVRLSSVQVSRLWSVESGSVQFG